MRPEGKAGTRPDADIPRCGVIVMGVSGSGKSTLGTCLAKALSCGFLEGDGFHAPASVAKMRAGQPLDDDDRWPWLDRLGAAVAVEAGAGEGGIAVAACSALKRSYRERLEAAATIPLLFVLLDADRDTLARRLRERQGHYMPASLLDSQLATLERPGPDENAMVLRPIHSPDRLCAEALEWVRAQALIHAG